MSRAIAHRYEDPLDRVWLDAAARIGLRVARSAECYASTDGRGRLIIGTDETLDADDCLAQMIFHELCHSLVQGPESFDAPDWGLDNESDRDLARERACLRVQAWLAGRHGLSAVLAPTTEHRAFYDGLGADPLAGDDASVGLARLGVVRSRRAPWAPHLAAALDATETIARAVGAAPLPPAGGGASLWLLVGEAPPSHPAGLRAHPTDARTCGDCAWQRLAGPGKPVPRCRQVDDARVDLAWPACERFDAPLDCLRCGACCREAFDTVEVAPRDPFVKRHPDLLERVDGRLVLRRVDGRCPPLRGDGSPEAPFTCDVYADRPRTCRDFGRGGASCLEARRAVGLSL